MTFSCRVILIWNGYALQKSVWWANSAGTEYLFVSNCIREQLSDFTGTLLQQSKGCFGSGKKCPRSSPTYARCSCSCRVLCGSDLHGIAGIRPRLISRKSLHRVTERSNYAGHTLQGSLLPLSRLLWQAGKRRSQIKSGCGML